MNSTESSSMTASIFLLVSQYLIYAGHITLSAGIVGNLINIFIFTNLKFFRSNRCVFYLTIESICDIISLFISIILTILTALHENNVANYSLFWCKLNYILVQTCGLITFSMICFASGDQFFSTNYRLNLRQMCTFKLARYLVFIIIIIWLIHSIVFSIFVNIVPPAICTISNPIAIRYATFFLYPVLGGLLSIIIASSFSLFAYRNVRRIVRRQIPIERRRFDRQITAMVLLRVVFFVCFTSPYIIYRIYVINTNIKQANPLQIAIAQLVQQIVIFMINMDYTANFYIFIASSSRYRRQVKHVLVKKFWRRWKSWCSVNRNEVRPEDPIPVNSNNEIE